MIESLFLYFDWVVGATTFICVELMIRRKWYAWVASIANQFVWLTFIVVKQQYGLLPLNILLFFQNTRGLLAWLKYERLASEEHCLSDPAPAPRRQAADAVERPGDGA